MVPIDIIFIGVEKCSFFISLLFSNKIIFLILLDFVLFELDWGKDIKLEIDAKSKLKKKNVTHITFIPHPKFCEQIKTNSKQCRSYKKKGEKYCPRHLKK